MLRCISENNLRFFAQICTDYQLMYLRTVNKQNKKEVMRYKLVIQALRESSDNNVLAFLKDVEKMKRLTAEERQYYLANREEADAVNILVKDFIPYIIKVAYVLVRRPAPCPFWI